MKNCLVIAAFGMKIQPRSTRQCRWLQEMGYDLTVMAADPPLLDNIRFIDINMSNPGRSILGIKWHALKYHVKCQVQSLFDITNKHAFKLIKSEPHDLVICHNLLYVKAAHALAKRWNCPFIINLHEYFPDDPTFIGEKRGIHTINLCSEYLPKADMVFSVSDEISNLYSKQFGIDCKTIMNCPLFHDISPNIADNKRISLVHHGNFSPERCHDIYFEIMRHLDRSRFEFHFYLSGDNGKIREFTKTNPFPDDIYFHAPVPMADLPRELNQYDIGIHHLEPNWTNHRFALPNKFFEFIQARNVVCIMGSQSVNRFVREYDLGFCDDDLDIKRLTGWLHALTTGEIKRYKANSDLAAHELCAEKEGEKFRQMLEALP